ncbi:hypothetical protein [Rubinisphaera brasiliensis]|uniref:Uncharacterized protein n=1 Tax=Rubinisphaera brasiliensis (strain ATCC 49424 / DSM 5305 / JCM 21570 / IAM 15109 / NBRC 103401 / IFAM 1448) TaxID=756272 RepID=F0SLB6_RUBBR|nr:hypothetical protein [Rubinisphaera brasiliensis]ADY62022.1 hypothetical protein Plabr_4450 [Rubinisphaera brasiliensis DSM 5305]
MTPEALSKLNDLQDDVRSMASRVAQMAADPELFANWSDAGLPEQMRQLDSRILQQRSELIQTLQQSNLEPPAAWNELSLNQLADYALAARTLVRINQQLADERLRLAAAESSPSAKKPLYAQLSEIEQLALDPPHPLPQDLHAFVENRHPVQEAISTFVSEVQSQAAPAESENVLPPGAPVESDEDFETPPIPAAASTSVPLTFADLLNSGNAPEKAEEEHEANSEQAAAFELDDSLTPDDEAALTEDVLADSDSDSLDAHAALETSEPASTIETEQPLAPVASDEDQDEGLIFDDFDEGPREKQILTAEDLSRQLEGVQDTGQQATATETQPPAEPLFSEDSVFDALEAAAIHEAEHKLTEVESPDKSDTSFPLETTAAGPQNADSTSVDHPASADRSDDAAELPPADYAEVRNIAIKAKGAQNRFDRVSYLSRLIWELISVGEYPWAYQVSRCLYANVDEDLSIPAPEPWLLKLLTLGDRMLLSSGRVAREFQSVITKHRSEALRIAESAEKPEAFLLRAALMRGTITTASPVAADVLRTYLILPDQTQLYNYCSRIASFSTRANGLKLDQYFYRPGAASVETEARAIRSLAQAWQGGHFNDVLSYRVSTPVFSRAFWSVRASAATARPHVMQQWRARQIVQAHIARLLQPILDNQLTRSAAMEEELNRLSRNVTVEGDDTHVVISDTETARLPGKEVFNHVQEALELGSHWMVLAASYPGIESVLVPPEINELRDEIDRRETTVFKELKALERTHNSHAHRAALTACRRNMDRIHQLFHPTEEPRLGEPDPQCLVNAELLKIPGVSLDDEWVCHSSPTTLEHPLLDTLTGEPIAWRDAFASQLEAGSYRSARGLLRLDHWRDSERDQLRRQMEEHRQDRAGNLRDLAERLKVQLEQSRHIEMISEREAKEYFARIVSLEQRIPSDYRLNEIRAELSEIRQTLDTRRGLELRRMQQRMDQISDFDVHGQSQGSPAPPANPPENRQPESPNDSDDDSPADDWALDV